MRAVRRVSAVIIGFVFFIAGILKLMDPVGAGLVVGEYLKFLHLGFLEFTARIAGPAMALFETVLGAALITGVWRKVVAVITWMTLGFFTLLTLAILIQNPNMDCGCFGEAIHLTHLQTFLKNIVLLALSALAFIPLSKQEPTRKVKYVSFSVAAASVCLFLLYSSLSIPLVDFTDYSPGTELGKQAWYDPTDYEPSPELSFSDVEGEYADSLALEGKVLISSVYDPRRMTATRWEKVAETLRTARANGYTTLVLAASTPEEMEELVTDPTILSSSYFADRRTLMTLNRSNGGMTLISDGSIMSKWCVRALPDEETLVAAASADITEEMLAQSGGRSLKLQGFLLYVFAVMLLL